MNQSENSCFPVSLARAMEPGRADRAIAGGVPQQHLHFIAAALEQRRMDVREMLEVVPAFPGASP
jgi:hypothetical protein